MKFYSKISCYVQTLNNKMASRRLLNLSVATILLSFHAANCYILLTANLEDVHSIAKQIAASPVASQLNKIIRRASSIFNDHLSKQGSKQIHQRAEEKTDEENDDNFDIWKPDPDNGLENFRAKASDTEASEVSGKSGEHSDKAENKVERRNSGNNDLVELGKNASFYLKSIKKIFESV